LIQDAISQESEYFSDITDGVEKHLADMDQNEQDNFGRSRSLGALCGQLAGK
jgi:hypothetical protein